MNLKICPGRPYPLGTTWDGDGTNLALFSEDATGVELCLYDDVYAKEASSTLLQFTKRLIALRREHPIFRRRKYFSGRKTRGTDIKDIAWFRPDGEEMTDNEWNTSFVKALGLRLAGDEMDEMNDQGEPLRDNAFLILMNAHHKPISFFLPKETALRRWELSVNTAAPEAPSEQFKSSEAFQLPGRALVLFKRV